MNKTTKIILSIVSIVIAVCIIGFANKSSETVANGQKPTIIIGATLPLSGNLAFLGDSYKNAMQLALADAEASGNLKYNYQIVYEDDKFDPATAASTVNKLISIDHADALASFGSPVGNVVSPIAQKDQIVHINGIASDPNVANGNYNFVHWTPPYQEVSLFIKQLQKRGIKSITVFETNQPGTLAVGDALMQQLIGTGIKVVATEKYNQGTTDYRSLIANAKAAGKADIYMLIAQSPELEILTKQIKDAGITTPLTCIESFEYTEQPKLFEGDWFVDAASMQPMFVQEYTQRYNEAPKLGAGNGYDVVKMLVDAFEASGDGKTKPSESSVQQYLANLKGYDGAMGRNLSIDSNGIIVTQATVKIMKNGQVVDLAQ